MLMQTFFCCILHLTIHFLALNLLRRYKFQVYLFPSLIMETDIKREYQMDNVIELYYYQSELTFRSKVLYGMLGTLCAAIVITEIVLVWIFWQHRQGLILKLEVNLIYHIVITICTFLVCLETCCFDHISLSNLYITLI